MLKRFARVQVSRNRAASVATSIPKALSLESVQAIPDVVEFDV